MTEKKWGLLIGNIFQPSSTKSNLQTDFISTPKKDESSASQTKLMLLFRGHWPGLKTLLETPMKEERLLRSLSGYRSGKLPGSL